MPLSALLSPQRVFASSNNAFEPTTAVGNSSTASSPATATLGSTLAATHRSFQVGNVYINVFPSAYALNHDVAHQLNREFQRPGLMILPADSTHGHETNKPDGEIYKLVNQYFANREPSSGLFVTHMDELNIADRFKNSAVEPEQFSTKLTSWLPNIIGNGENTIGARFHAIDPKNLDEYSSFVNDHGGARVIVGGVGAEVPPHIAYIGEEHVDGRPVINDAPKLIPLREAEAKRRGVKTAATMGMSFFDSPQLESVIINAKGAHKANSIHYALRDGLLNDAPSGQSAFGAVIKKFAQSSAAGQKLVLNFDQEAWNTAFLDKGLRSKLQAIE